MARRLQVRRIALAPSITLTLTLILGPEDSHKPDPNPNPDPNSRSGGVCARHALSDRCGIDPQPSAVVIYVQGTEAAQGEGGGVRMRVRAGG